MLTISQNLLAQTARSIFLIGDAGNDTTPNKTLLSLKDHLESTPNSMVVFLGDNIYPRGLDGTLEAQQKLMSQLSMLKKYNGEWIFIPGNHDWAKGRWKGYKNILRQQDFLEKFAHDSMANRTYQFEHFFPKKGLPGPSVVDLGKTMLIITDTDWWLQRQFFHEVGKTDPFPTMEKQYLKSLDSVLNVAKKTGKFPVFMSHHPLVNMGKHALPNEPWRALVNYTPLQVFGIMGLNRAFLSENQQPRYQRMARKMLTILTKYEPYIAVSGHEHDLQYIQQGKAVYLISGSGSKLVEIPVKSFENPELKFGKSVHGFMELVLEDAGKISVIVWGEDGKELYRKEGLF